MKTRKEKQGKTPLHVAVLAVFLERLDLAAQVLWNLEPLYFWQGARGIPQLGRFVAQRQDLAGITAQAEAPSRAEFLSFSARLWHKIPCFSHWGSATSMDASRLLSLRILRHLLPQQLDP